jgi:hypothetical protein
MLETLALTFEVDVRVLAILLAAPVAAVFATLTYRWL